MNESDYLYHYNQLILSWGKERVDQGLLKTIKRIFERVLKQFPKVEDREMILSTLVHFPVDLAESVFSGSQMDSKQWIVEVLKELKQNSLGNVFILGGWCGLINRYIQATNGIDVGLVYSIDLDSNAQRFSDLLNGREFKEGLFKAVIKDARDLSFKDDSLEVHDGALKTVSCKTIINTSCEHMDDHWISNIPKGILVIAQSNDDDSIIEHKYCSENLDCFKERLGLEEVLYSGELDFPKYKRFMVIGYK